MTAARAQASRCQRWLSATQHSVHNRQGISSPIRRPRTRRGRTNPRGNACTWSTVEVLYLQSKSGCTARHVDFRTALSRPIQPRSPIDDRQSTRTIPTFAQLASAGTTNRRAIIDARTWVNSDCRGSHSGGTRCDDDFSQPRLGRNDRQRDRSQQLLRARP